MSIFVKQNNRVYNYSNMKARNKFRKRSEYLYPLKVIKNNHFSKRDLRVIKDNISLNMTVIRLIVAVLLMLVAFGMFLMMNLKTGWRQIEVYGLSSVIAQVLSFSFCLISVILIVISYFAKKDKTTIILNRVAGLILYLGIALQMLFGIYADCEMGFTTTNETLSASIIFLAALLVIQPAYWTEALILDLATTISTIGLSLYCSIAMGMTSIHYYIIIALAFPLCAYFIITLLFYAECQNYKEAVENERLTNKAYYDDLTHCKNRHALKMFIDENKENWETNDNLNLLIAMFDIDNFKDYNDQFSHLAGDYCLKSITDAIRKAFPSPDLDFFRYGGEEFLLFFELDNPMDARKVLEKARTSVEELNIDSPKGAPKKMVTISIGGVIIKNIGKFDFEKEISEVDKYLYQAKNNGKDVSCLDGKVI